MREALPLVAGGLAGLYLALAALHAVFLARPTVEPLQHQGVMIWLAAGSAVALAALRWSLLRGWFGVRQAHPVAFAVLMIVLLNSSVHLAVLGAAEQVAAGPAIAGAVSQGSVQSTNFMLLLVGASCVMLSARWLVATMAVTWAAWGMLAAAFVRPELRWHFGIGLAMSTAVGGVILSLRLQGLGRLEKLIAEQRRTLGELLVARDAAHEASRAKSEFLANMSHELRTPLNSVVGTTELLLASPLDPRQRELARTLHRGAETLLSVISNLLDISKSEAGKLSLDVTDFELSRLVGGVVDFASEAARAKGLRWHWRTDVSMPDRVRGDELRLRQVLVNLLENAVKFTESGEVGLSLRLTSVPAGGWLARFAVRDTGPGVVPDLQAQLFRPFTQLESTPGPAGRPEGSGLGLGVCRQWVELMGGRIGVQPNESARGSEFWFEVPLLPPAAAVAAERHAPAAVAAARYRVLVAEANEVNQLFARRTIESLGHAVAMAKDADEVVAQASDGEYDIVLMDLQLPGAADGFESARRLRESMGSRCPRIVGVTANARVGDRERCLAGGLDEYLTKPLRRSEVAAVFERALGRQGPAAATR